jgi:nitroreductase
MDFYDVVRTRRSVRKYSDRAIPEEVLTRVLEATRVAPSGSNRQPTRLILVNDPAVKEQLVALCHNQAFVATAPIIVVACGRDLNYNRGEWMGRGAILVDTSIVVDHLTLAARAEGLGTCWIGSFNGPALKQFFSLPDDIDVCAVTPLGYPAEEGAFGEPQQRMPREELVMWNAWRA